LELFLNIFISLGEGMGVVAVEGGSDFDQYKLNCL